MVVELHETEPPRIWTGNGEVHIHEFVETDPTVLRVVDGAEDPEAMVHAVLRVGAQATLVARTDFEAAVVERRFEGMAQTFDTTIEGAVATISEMSERLLDEEEGALPKIFGEVKSDIASILEATFDEDSKSSVIAKIDTVLEDAVQRLDRNVRSAFDPDAPDSALGRMKHEITETVKDQVGGVSRDLKELALALAANRAHAEAIELTAVKGFAYEDVVEAGLARIAAVHGDLLDRVGTSSGSSGTKHGDHLVTLNPEDTYGHEARIVIECKDRKLGMRKAMEEVEKAMENHDALAGIVVFSRQDLAPTPTPFFNSGNRAVVVLDKAEPDPLALQLAYTWGRWVARRELALDVTDVDFDRVEAAIGRARQALARYTVTKGCFTTATRKIAEGSQQIGELVADVRAALDELWEELKQQ
jgi:hypothetical protein